MKPLRLSWPGSEPAVDTDMPAPCTPSPARILCGRCLCRTVHHAVPDAFAYALNCHCMHCGSLLYSVLRDGAWVHVTLGTLEGSPTIRPSAHIFAGSKAPWFTITDDLPQRQEFG